MSLITSLIYLAGSESALWFVNKIQFSVIISQTFCTL